MTGYSLPDFTGYFIAPAVLSSTECDALISTLADTNRSRAGARHLMSNPTIAELADHPRLLAIAREALDYVRTHNQVECVVPRGGVLAMRPLLIHCSSKARTEHPRRVLHIEYADTLHLRPGIRLAVA